MFEDTSYVYLANAFTIDTGADTVGATAKHIFMVFERHRGLETVAPDDGFRSWSLRSSRDTGCVVPTRAVINADSTESIGAFSGLKARDWMVFELGAWADGIHPLKVRHTSLEPGDTIYAVGRSRAERQDPDPTIVQPLPPPGARPLPRGVPRAEHRRLNRAATTVAGDTRDDGTPRGAVGGRVARAP